MATVNPELSDSELIEKYVDSMRWRELRETTVYIRRKYLEKLSREIGPFRNLTEQSLQDWLGRPSLQPQSRNIWLTTVHCFFVWANHEGYFRCVKGRRGNLIDFDPTIEIVKPKTKKGKPHPISDADLTEALRWATKDMRCWLMFGALGGCRCMEIAGVLRDNIHEDDPEPWFRVLGKGNKERDIPLHPDLIEALRAFGMPESGALWNMTPQAMSKAINNHLHGLDIKSTAHALRHAYATNMYRLSTDLQLVADLLGHSNTAITSVYAAADHRRASGFVAQLKIGVAA